MSTTLPILYRPAGSAALPDNDQYTNRFEIKSQSSNRVYLISQHKKHRHFCCSCPGWKRHRHCKHLGYLGLPGDEQPFEVKLAGAR